MFLAILYGMRDLSSPTKDQPAPTTLGAWCLTTGPPGKSQNVYFIYLFPQNAFFKWVN